MKTQGTDNKKNRAALIKEKAAYCEEHGYMYDINDPGFLKDTHYMHVVNAYEKKGGKA